MSDSCESISDISEYYTVLSPECTDFVNSICKERGLVNRLFGVKYRKGVIWGKILPEDNEDFWFRSFQLCSLQEDMIEKWISMGGTIDEEE